MSEETNVGQEVALEEGAGKQEPEDAADETVYAYVRQRDSHSAGAVVRVAEDQLHEYLLDVIGLPFNGGVVDVPAAYPSALKATDKTPDAVRGLRAAAEQEGFLFQWVEVSKADWEATQTA